MAQCSGGSSFAIYIFSFQVVPIPVAGAAQLPAESHKADQSSNRKTSLDASPMPLEELHGMALAHTANRATLQHGWEASERSSTHSSPKAHEEI